MTNGADGTTDLAAHASVRWAIVILFATLCAILVTLVLHFPNVPARAKGWIAGDHRVRTFLGSHDIGKLPTWVLARGKIFDRQDAGSRVAHRFLDYLLRLEDAERAGRDLYGHVAASSEFRFTNSMDGSAAVTVCIYDSVPGSVIIWFGDNDNDRLCIALSPNIRKAYEEAVSELRLEAKGKVLPIH